MDKKIKNWSFIICLSMFIVGMTSFAVLREIPAYDYWWHLKSGEYMVLNKTIPFIDVFSWYGVQEELYWHSHEWLSAVTIYLFDAMFGHTGGYIFCIVTLFSLVLTLFWFNKDLYFKHIKFTLIWIILGVLTLIPVITARPHMISFILLSITMYLLSDIRRNENSKKIYLLPLVSILWVNFHGGSSNLPYVLAFMVLITGLFNFKLGRLVGTKLSKKQQLKLLIVGVLSIFALVINPHGFDMITYPYVNMTDSFMLSIIQEWRSPDLKLLDDTYIFIQLFMIAVILLLNKEDLDFTDMGFIGGMVFLTFKSIRFSVLLYIVSSFIIFKYIPKLKDEKALKEFTTVFGAVGLAFIIFFMTEIPNRMEEPMKISISDEIIQTIKEENPKRLYNDYDFGGYLIYNEIPVFVDGRADMYSGHNLKDAINLSRLDVNCEEILEKYNFDMFVIYKDAPLNYILKNNKDYIKLIEDEKIVVYKNIKNT